MEVRHRITYELNGRVFGKGPAVLLQVIKQTGSLRESARQLGLSYTKAFQMIKQAETRLGYPLLNRTVGGSHGGGSTLSEQALQLLEDYHRIDKLVGTYAQEKQNELEQARLIETLNRYRSARVISIIGGGGKTTLVHWLCAQRAMTGSSLLTSTTAMFRPDFLPVDFERVTTEANPVALFSHQIRQDKLKGVEPEEIDRLKASGRFDSIIVEADGSKGLPLKSYGEYEPPIPQSSDLVILVIGVDGFYQPIEEVVHRPEIYAAMTRSRLRSPVTAKNYLRHFRNANGALKNVPDCPVLVMLNRIDLLEDRQVLAELIPGLLSNERVEAVLLTDLSDYRLETVFRNEV